MPVVSMTLPDVEQAVVRPAIVDIIHQIENIVKIPATTRIMFPGEMGTSATSRSTIDEEQDRRAIFTNDRYLYVEVEQSYNEDMISSTAVHQREHNPVFLDREIRVALWPVYLSTNYTINFRYSTLSKTEAVRWRDDIYAKITQMRDLNLHDITYHYQLPNELWELIRVIHEHKSRLQTTPETFEHYVKSHATDRLMLLSDMTNKNYALAVAEKQTRIVGQFDFSPVPEKIEREDTGVWICSFGYKLTFEKPALIGCRYPITVYNRILPAEYVTFLADGRDDENKHDYSRSLSMEALSMFEATRQLEAANNIYVPYRIPEFDEIKVRTGPAGYASALSVLTEVDEDTRRGLFNLRDLSPYALDEDLLDFIATSEYPYIHHAYHSVLYIGLYKNYGYASDRMLRCNHDLELTAAVDLNLTQPYHVMFSLLVDLPYLKEAAVERLKKHPRAFVKIVQCINEALRNFPELEILAKKPRVTTTDFNRFFRHIVSYNTKTFPGPNNVYQSPTTMAYLNELDSHGRPKFTREQRPTYQDSLYANDPIQPYRGEIWERIRADSIGFKRQQLSSILTIHHQR